MTRQKDPTRARRRTGNRPMPGEVVPDTEGQIIRLLDHAGPPDPPGDLLPEVARELWVVAMDELWSRGLRHGDLPAIRLMCEQAAIAYEAANGPFGWATRGVIIPDPRSAVWDSDLQRRVPTAMMENPSVGIGQRATDRYVRIAQNFGLDIASRMRLGLMQLAGQSMTDALLSEVERD